MRCRAPRSGMTLIEVVAAISVLGLLAVGLFAWTATEVRTARTTEARLQAFVAAVQIARSLRDDLAAAVPNSQGKRVTPAPDLLLHYTTLQPTPGDPLGAHAVRWVWVPADRALWRGVVGAQPTLVARWCAQVQVAQDGQQRWWLALSDQSTGEPWRFLIGAEP